MCLILNLGRLVGPLGLGENLANSRRSAMPRAFSVIAFPTPCSKSCRKSGPFRSVGSNTSVLPGILV